ncbi:MAG: hypothetical protein AAF958_10030 [Planctomycetota bacterium]
MMDRSTREAFVPPPPKRVRAQGRWHRRGRRCLVVVGLVATLGMIAFSILPVPRRWIKPGPLSSPHARILSQTPTADACIVCHDANSLTGQTSTWVGTTVSWLSGHAGDEGTRNEGPLQGSFQGQSGKCMLCHEQQIAPENAMRAHNLSAADRKTIRLASRSQATSGNHVVSASRRWSEQQLDGIACASCHREHHGDDRSLVAMTDKQCQTCHARHFESFSNGHPEFRRGGRNPTPSIAFDHASHFHRHFPETGQRRFDCRACHAIDRDGHVALGVDYRRGCADCHDASLKSAAEAGLTLLALPEIDATAAAAIHGYPTELCGSTLQPIEEMGLWLGLPKHSIASGASGANDDSGVADAIARLDWLEDVALGGQAAWSKRMQEAGVPAKHADVLAGTLSPQLVREATSLWLRVGERKSSSPLRGETGLGESRSPLRGETHGPLENTSLNDPLLQSDQLLLSEDSLLDVDASDDLLDPFGDGKSDPLGDGKLGGPSTNPSDEMPRFRPLDHLLAGGWYRDDARFEIRYQGGAHDDRTLQAVIEVLYQTDFAKRSKLDDHPVIQACTRCHLGLMRGLGWRSQKRIRGAARLTHFNHSPHLQIAQTLDCQSCHRVRENTVAEESTKIRQASFFAPQTTTQQTKTQQMSSIRHSACGLEPIQKDQCVGCHRPGVVRENCTTCHDYHATPHPATPHPATLSHGSNPVHRR